MSGRASRRKGKSNEYLVRDHLRSLGYEANRVPSSGASQGFKGDVVATKEGKSLIIEVKSRKNSFKTLYDALGRSKKDTVSVWYQGVGIALSNSLSGALDAYIFDAWREEDLLKQTANKLLNMSKLLGKADVLIVKDDYKPLLFIRYVLP